MRCKYCQNPCYKKGKRNNSQRYQCKICRKYQQDIYTRPRIPEAIYKGIASWVGKKGEKENGAKNPFSFSLFRIASSSCLVIAMRVIRLFITSLAVQRSSFGKMVFFPKRLNKYSCLCPVKLCCESLV